MTDYPIRDSSMLSTLNQTQHQSARTGLYTDTRPQTANLIYSNKPYIKQTPQWNQSSSTWRHSSRKQSFSKDRRFRSTIPYSLDILKLNIEPQKSNKKCTQGKGKRVPISQVVLRNAKQKPAPDAYDMQCYNETTRSPKKGKTFGQYWDKYTKIYIDHRKDVYSSHFVEDNPPAKYNIRESPGKSTRAFSAYSRLKMYTQKMSQSKSGIPGPQYQLNDRHLYNTIGLSTLSFTTGSRMDLSAPANNYPGSQYLIPGFCDKYKNTKKKTCPA